MTNLIVYSYNTGSAFEGWSVRWNGKGKISRATETALIHGVYFKTKEEALAWVNKISKGLL